MRSAEEIDERASFALLLDGGARQLDCTDQNRIKCIPTKSAWAGGDEIALIFGNRIKNKGQFREGSRSMKIFSSLVFDITFDFGSFGQRNAEEQIQIDTKTIIFRTPECLILPSNAEINVTLIIRSDKSVLTRIDFQYLTRERCRIRSNHRHRSVLLFVIPAFTAMCMNCQKIKNNYNSPNKRRTNLMFDCVTDGGESLLKSMNQLSLQSVSWSRSEQSNNLIHDRLDATFEHSADISHW